MLLDAGDRTFDPLPIDNGSGLPQSFGYVRDGVRYLIALYASIPEDALGAMDEIMALPDNKDRYLIVRVDAFATDGASTTVFLRKVVPSLVYRAGGLVLRFPMQTLARGNLNGIGNFGTNIVGEVASL
jgi:hypothetical protein